MDFIVFDLEATCWRSGDSPSRKEIIEISAVRLGSQVGPIGDEFGRFVRPVAEPILGDFCVELTTIRQHDVDTAETFLEVFQAFLRWIGSGRFIPCSWGAYDLKQIRLDCGRHGLDVPPAFDRHINLKAEFARQQGARPCGMAQALSMSGMSLEGTHHRGIDDARNIARLATLILPQIHRLGKD